MKERLRKLLNIKRDDLFYDVDIEKQYEYDLVILTKEGIEIKKDNSLILWDEVYSINVNQIDYFSKNKWKTQKIQSLFPWTVLDIAKVNYLKIFNAFWHRILVERHKTEGFLEGTAFWKKPDRSFSGILKQYLKFPALLFGFFLLIHFRDYLNIFAIFPIVFVLNHIINFFYYKRHENYWKWRLEGAEMIVFSIEDKEIFRYEIVNRKRRLHKAFFSKNNIYGFIMASNLKTDSWYEKVYFPYRGLMLRFFFLWPPIFAVSLYLFEVRVPFEAGNAFLFCFFIGAGMSILMGFVFLLLKLSTILEKPLVMEKVQWIREYLAEK